MKTAVLLGLLALAGTMAYFAQQQENSSNLRAGTANLDLYQVYSAWKQAHNLKMSASEDTYRFKVFQANKAIIDEHNSLPNQSFKMGLNAFAAMTLDEFKERLTTKMTQSASNQQVIRRSSPLSDEDIPSSVNWVQKGAVTEVTNQGHCGSCWAFSTVGGLEGVYAIQSGDLVPLSPQQLVDCSKWNLGCNGGDPMTAYRYTQKNGIIPEADYPYHSGNEGDGKRGQCQYDELKDKVLFRNTDQVRVEPENNANAILKAASQQPLTIEVSAGNVAFQLYSSGVLNSKYCGTDLDHGVTLVGYDTVGAEFNNTPFYTIKNSWGTSWGNQGYGNIAIEQSGPGVCGINQYAAYPTWNGE